MNNLEISTEPSLLNVDSSQSLNTSPSVSTFLPEEDASTCPLLPTTPSPPPPMHFNHPLTLGDGTVNEMTGDDARAETSSCSGSSGIGMEVQVAGTTTLFNQNVYQHLGKNGEVTQEAETMLHANLNIPASKDAPSFVYWNWPLIRKCTFFCFIAVVIAMVAVVVSMIVSLPKTCNPKTVWYKGSVFYEIFPASFQDSNGDGLGDLQGLGSRVDYLKQLGVTGIRLNSIFPSKNYPNHFQNVTSLQEIDEILGKPNDLIYVTKLLNDKNMSLVLDLPIYPFLNKLEPIEINQEKSNTEKSKVPTPLDDGNLRLARSTENKNTVIDAMQLWIRHGVDGFYIKGIEHFHNDPLLLENVRAWKNLLGPNRVLIVSNDIFEKIDQSLAERLMKYIDLVDIYINVNNGTKQIAEHISKKLSGILAPGDGPYIQWSLGGISERLTTFGLTSNATLAATLMSLMLPGSPSVFYGDEISLQELHNSFGDNIEPKHLRHLSAMAWNTIPELANHEPLSLTSHKGILSSNHFGYVANMIALRDTSPSIYQNVIKKGDKIEQNTSVKFSQNGNILILERWYPRRNTFVSITNLDNKNVSLDLSSSFYSGEVMVGKLKHQRIYFNDFEIGPIETIIIKLDK